VSPFEEMLIMNFLSPISFSQNLLKNAISSHRILETDLDFSNHPTLLFGLVAITISVIS
jgi:hypothetical protein